MHIIFSLLQQRERLKDIASSPVEKTKGEIVLRNRDEGRDRIIAGRKGGGDNVLRNREGTDRIIAG